MEISAAGSAVYSSFGSANADALTGSNRRDAQVAQSQETDKKQAQTSASVSAASSASSSSSGSASNDNGSVTPDRGNKVNIVV